MKLDDAIRALPANHPGPGGAAAVLRRGEVLARHAWGWADAELRVAFTTATPFRVCSITKQFTCALLRDLFEDTAALDGDVRAAMPLLAEPAPDALAVCHNQSGLRDYWALAALCGAPVERGFDDRDAEALIGRTRTLQFSPGTRYSYANQNFRILSDILERRTGLAFDELLRTHIFDRVGMAAFLAATTQTLAGGAVGYEGTTESGLRPAVNRIRWTGDAGIAATLDDMIAWERFIDRTRDEADGLFGRLTAPVRFNDGGEASYGFGLSRTRLHGEAAFSHGGALRGWRSFRAYLPGPRVSVVVFFNHMSDARSAALALLAAVLPDQARPNQTGPNQTGPNQTGPEIKERFVEPQTRLAVRLEASAVLFAAQRETIGNGVSIRVEDDGVWMDRPAENMSSRLRPVSGPAARDIEGMFRSDEFGAMLTCAAAGGVLYGAFSGVLGEGSMTALVPFGPDLWLLPCPRALDHPAPGDWTLAFERDESGRVDAVEVGCWLARRIRFARQA